MDEIKNKKIKKIIKKNKTIVMKIKKGPNWIQKLNEIKCWRTKSKNQIYLKANKL